MRYFLQQIGNFSDEEVAAIESAGIPKRAPAKATLFTASAPFLKLWFITEGMMRTYRIIEGEDYTFFFFTKNDFAVDYESFLTEEQSPLFFEALVDTTSNFPSRPSWHCTIAFRALKKSGGSWRSTPTSALPSA